jgi:hypothetical protein
MCWCFSTVCLVLPVWRGASGKVPGARPSDKSPRAPPNRGEKIMKYIADTHMDALCPQTVENTPHRTSPKICQVIHIVFYSRHGTKIHCGVRTVFHSWHRHKIDFELHCEIHCEIHKCILHYSTVLQSAAKRKPNPATSHRLSFIRKPTTKPHLKVRISDGGDGHKHHAVYIPSAGEFPLKYTLTT